MDDGDKAKSSWWQTLPGILTALAGIVTAAAGLLVTLHQIGLIGNKDKPIASSSSTSNDPAKSPGESTPTATPSNQAAPSKAELPQDKATTPIAHPARQYSVSFPSGIEATVRSSRADAIYKVLSSHIEMGNAGKHTLKLSVRLTNIGRSDLSFGTGSFRLRIDGIPRAPINFLNDLVEARSAKEGDIVFELPDTAENLVLLIQGYGEDSAEFPMTLKK
jgi:hypothetical protein